MTRSHHHLWSPLIILGAMACCASIPHRNSKDVAQRRFEIDGISVTSKTFVPYPSDSLNIPPSVASYYFGVTISPRGRFQKDLMPEIHTHLEERKADIKRIQTAFGDASSNLECEHRSQNNEKNWKLVAILIRGYFPVIRMPALWHTLDPSTSDPGIIADQKLGDTILLLRGLRKTWLDISRDLMVTAANLGSDKAAVEEVIKRLQESADPVDQSLVERLVTLGKISDVNVRHRMAAELAKHFLQTEVRHEQSTFDSRAARIEEALNAAAGDDPNLDFHAIDQTCDDLKWFANHVIESLEAISVYEEALAKMLASIDAALEKHPQSVRISLQGNLAGSEKVDIFGATHARLHVPQKVVHLLKPDIRATLRRAKRTGNGAIPLDLFRSGEDDPATRESPKVEYLVNKPSAALTKLISGCVGTDYFRPELVDACRVPGSSSSKGRCQDETLVGHIPDENDEHVCRNVELEVFIKSSSSEVHQAIRLSLFELQLITKHTKTIRHGEE